MTTLGLAPTASGLRRGRDLGLSPAERARRRIYWPLVLPALLVYLLLFVAPALYSVWVSLTQWRGSGDPQIFVGIRNYVRLWNDDVFRQSFVNSLSIVFVAGAGVFLVALVVSSLLRELKHAQLIQTILFFPYMLSPIAVGVALALVFVPDGLLNSSLRAVGLGVLAQPWLTPDLAFKAVIVGLVWLSSGFYILLMLSAIGRIPKYYYEQAELDGASRFQTFRHVTLPMTWDVLTVAVVLWMIGAVRVFEFVYGFIGGGSALPPPQVRTIAVEQFLATTGGPAPQYDMGIGSAMGVVMVVLILIFVVATRRIMRREALEF
jgi:raffinose/stachyose/melibiose transport system permease protein